MFQLNSAKLEALFNPIETPSFLTFKNGVNGKGVNKYFLVIY
jgi:hypothetical protein